MSRRNQQPQPQSEEQAEEAPESLDLNSQPPQSEGQGDDLIEDPQLDYQPIPELDQYKNEGIDDQEDHQLNPQAIRAAEREIKMRQAEIRNEPDLLDQILEEEEEDLRFERARQQFYMNANLDQDQEEQFRDGIDPQDERVSFPEWVKTHSVRSYIKRTLIRFLTHFTLDSKPIYLILLKQMCISNEQSLYIQYAHLKEAAAKLAYWLVRYPAACLPQYSAALYSLACSTYPSYREIIGECYFRITQIPLNDKIRNLSYKELGNLIRIKGVVTCVSPVYSQLRKIAYKCIRCGHIKGPFFNQNSSPPVLGSCFSCQGSGPYTICQSKCLYRNHQTLTMQEAPSDVAPGRIPRSKELVVFGDNIDRVKAGDSVDAVGAFITKYNCALNVQQGFPVFKTIVEVNSIVSLDRIKRNSFFTQTQFSKFPLQQDFTHRLYNSIAPSIYGHFKVKKALTLALFGGVMKNNYIKHHRTRGDLNVLLLGDPGIAKSQFLKSIQQVVPKCIYTTGKGASAVGLTAAVRMDPVSKQWMLQAGALVLADKGICLIDQFDKMSSQDRTSIHEAMEQQTISISKAGIVANLNARCSVIAAANPLGGYYNETISFKDNVELSQPILSRFDILCVLKDRPDETIDGSLADFVINQHIINHPYKQQYYQEDKEQHKIEKRINKRKDKAIFEDQTFIKEYIRYARLNFQPKLGTRTSQIIKSFYQRLREYSQTSGGINIVVRHLQSMIRIAQAHAKMHLRKETNEQDGKVAISTMLKSFMDTQRHSTARKIQHAFKFDILPEDL